ncbi:MAG: sulfotransferase [Desulfobacteraceae bacterium]|nr:sulfotransferase [Desulfobacteraceae bacterium]
MNMQRFEGLQRPPVSEAVTLVSGLPRSGTSMMMRMLAAGGMHIVTDNIRRPNADNPNGYFELEKIKELENDASWLRDEKGRAIKAISAFLPMLPKNSFYYVIFMQRHMDEILASQKKMLERRGADKGDEGVSDERMATKYQSYLEATYKWLRQQDHFHVLYVHYSNVLQDPLGQARGVNAFLQHTLDPGEMATAVDPDLYRQRTKDAV